MRPVECTRASHITASGAARRPPPREEFTRAGVFHGAGHPGVPVDGFQQGGVGFPRGCDTGSRGEEGGRDQEPEGGCYAESDGSTHAYSEFIAKTQ